MPFLRNSSIAFLSLSEHLFNKDKNSGDMLVALILILIQKYYVLKE